MTDARVESTDVLIIGSGGAGLRAAIAAADHGLDVTLLGKCLLGKAHTVMAEGGIAAALGNVEPEDDWHTHFLDTMEDGIWISDYRMVEHMCKTAPDIIKELEEYGAVFDRTEDGKIMQRAFGAHRFKRTCHVGDRTGLEIMTVLSEQVGKRSDRIDNLEECIATSLVKNQDRCTGATVVNMQTGEFFAIEADATIMAAGGYARLYKRTTNPWETTGDGPSMAYQIGAELMDMEMVQFHPTGMVWPESVEGVLVTESVRGEGGQLYNSEGERFMEHYDEERMELSARDIVARAIFTEVHEGRGFEHGGVHLDISHRDEEFIRKKLPKVVGKFKDLADVDLTSEPVEVAPTAHYTMGGIRVDPDTGESTVPGLYAAGEVAAGVHGANRLGSNSLTDILVFGRTVGRAAAQAVTENSVDAALDMDAVAAEQERIASFHDTEDGVDPLQIQQEIQDVMWENVGIMRDEETLTAALQRIEDLKADAEHISIEQGQRFNPALLAALSVRHMLICAEAVIRSALNREESRGAHHREDYPETNDAYLVNMACVQEEGEMVVNQHDVPVPGGDLLDVCRRADCPY